MIVRESFHDELVNTVQRDPMIRCILDGHSDQGDVRVRRLLCMVIHLHVVLLLALMSERR